MDQTELDAGVAMSLEIEKKYRLTKEQYKQVLADLEELEADFFGEDFEENLLFGNEELKNRGAVIRIRKTEKSNTLTFKQFVSNRGGLKKQIEHETKIENAEEAAKIIELLGFEMRMVYEKKRKTWKFREVEIVLDELPFGLFMEIEGPMMAIAEAEMFLDADRFAPEAETYPFLTKRLGKKVENRIEARFGNNESREWIS